MQVIIYHFILIALLRHIYTGPDILTSSAVINYTACMYSILIYDDYD